MRTCVILGVVIAAAARTPAPAIELYTVPVPIKSNRLLGMSRDEDGCIWCGSFLKAVHRYDPRSGQIDTIHLPHGATASACLCVGTKVYILGQTYPRLVIYDRIAKTFSEAKYPSDKPEVWYGTEAIDGRHLYLFDRGSVGMIKWDTQTDTGNAIPYPYQPQLPGAGRYVAADNALWCSVTDHSKRQYLPIGIARFDLKQDAFTDYFPFPSEAAELAPFSDPEATLFFPWTLQGKLVPFDFKARRWRQPLAVPEYGTRFGFIGQATAHRGRWYFSISTYNGTDLGCDGKPFHFCNGLLEFDPATRGFAFPTLESRDAYYQVSYTLSAGGELYATGSNIRQSDGVLNARQNGDIVVWTTRKPNNDLRGQTPRSRAVAPFGAVRLGALRSDGNQPAHPNEYSGKSFVERN